jgi:hypothetical protein
VIANVHWVGGSLKVKVAVLVHPFVEQLLLTICAVTERPDVVVVGVTVTEAEFVPVVTVKVCVTGVATRSIVVRLSGVIVVVVAGCLYPARDEIPIAYWLEADREFVTVDPLMVATDGIMKLPLVELFPVARWLEDEQVVPDVHI